uniref:Uncharacterized protein n=1 Tax=Arundo donax TaxID=35708 RepID=A0A0A9FU58_ARUDO
MVPPSPAAASSRRRSRSPPPSSYSPPPPAIRSALRPLSPYPVDPRLGLDHTPPRPPDRNPRRSRLDGLGVLMGLGWLGS